MEGWCLEFVVRNQSIESEHIKELLKVTSGTKIDYSTMKVLMLKILEDDLLSKASTSEWMLDLLESFEKLIRLHSDPSNPNPISDAMKSAYLAIAVECTVKYLETGTSNPKYYLLAVDRIWNHRFQRLMEGSYLLTPKFKLWKRKIDASLSNSQIMLELASMSDNRRKTIQMVQSFLKDARNNLGGPSFLHSVAAAAAGYFFSPFLSCCLLSLH